MATPFLTLAAAHGVQWPLATRRLELRPFAAEDAEIVWGYRSQPGTRTWTVLRESSPEEFRKNLLDSQKLLLACLPDGTIVGDVGVTIQDAFAQDDTATEAHDRQAMLSWVLHPDHTGRGYATEMVSATIDALFSNTRVRRVIAACFAPNVSSRMLMERIGMRRESYFVREALHSQFGWVDAYTYAVLAEEWAAAGQTKRGNFTMTNPMRTP